MESPGHRAIFPVSLSHVQPVCGSTAGEGPSSARRLDGGAESDAGAEVGPDDVWIGKEQLGYVPDAGNRPGPGIKSLGQSCKKDDDCQGSLKCIGSGDTRYCSIKCTPDDPKTLLVIEDTCPKQNTYKCGKTEKDGVETCCFCVKQPMGR